MSRLVFLRLIAYHATRVVTLSYLIDCLFIRETLFCRHYVVAKTSMLLAIFLYFLLIYFPLCFTLYLPT